MKWLRRKHSDEGQAAVAGSGRTPVCEHLTLVPRWDAAGDIGQSDKVSSYRCEACAATFTLDEATQLRATEAARVQRRIAS